MKIFNKTCKEHNIIHNPDECFKYINEYIEENNQITLLQTIFRAIVYNFMLLKNFNDK